MNMVLDLMIFLFDNFVLIFFATFGSVSGSGESRIVFLPERCSSCQYRPKISAINVKSNQEHVYFWPTLYYTYQKYKKRTVNSENHFKINQKTL